MQIRKLRTGNLVANWRGHDKLVTSLVFTPDGKSLLSGSWDSQVKQWDISFLGSYGIVSPPISDVMEISPSLSIGHTVCLLILSLTHRLTLSFRTGLRPSLFLLMVNGWRMGHRVTL